MKQWSACALALSPREIAAFPRLTGNFLRSPLKFKSYWLINLINRGSCKTLFPSLGHSERSEESNVPSRLRSFTAFRMTKTAFLQEAQSIFIKA
jgi:hypothetical protein